MKKILNFVLAACFITGALNAQTKINEGKIIVDLTYPGTDMDPNMVAMMPSEGALYFKKEMSRMEMKTGIGNITVISNAKDGSAVSLMDMMGNKMAMKVSKDDAAKEKAQAPKPEVKITDETKEIAGYKCIKAIVTYKGKEPHTSNVWFTKDIEGRNSSKYSIDGIDGFLMEYEVAERGINTKLTVRSVEKEPVDDAMFKIPEGYKEMTMEDMKKMGGR